MSSPSELAPAPRSTPGSAALQVAGRLTDEVVNLLALGDQLPSEADLAQRFSVSRVTVREALKILEGRGMVGLSRGRRATVAQPDGAMFGAFLRSLIRSDPKAMFDLVQVRRVLEVQSVTYACRNASRTGLAAVEAALAAMQDAARAMPDDGSDPVIDAAFDRADVRFHQALTLAGGNRVLTYLFEAMETSLFEAFATSHRGLPNSSAILRAAYQNHREIFDLIVARDERAAIDAMTAHLARAEANLRLAVGTG
jgi:GntR family transcriptional regulator, transcriptional repressor for pyruvate dehydrogenase complex